MPSTDEIADQLYTLPPAEFTSARDEAVANARGAGDRAAAKDLAALKRPTQGAHLVNLLALRDPEVVAELVALGQEIRAAQGSVAATQLRDLSTKRRSAIGAALRRCRSLAAEAGSGEPTAQQLAEAEATLAAAMADDAAADLVRSGRVVKALSYAGFGAGFGATGPVRAPTAPPVRSAPAPAARAQDDAARERLARAEAALGAAREQERVAHEEMDRISDEITRLRTALDTASKKARDARNSRQAAERAFTLARREVSTEEGGA